MLKKQSNLKRLLGYAGRHRYLSYASWVLSAASALVALVPYVFIWRIMQKVLAVAPDFSRAQGLVRNGWLAVLFAGIAVLIYIAGLMCSHMGAFRVATNLRIEAMRHIVKLPLGAAEAFGSGRLRKIVNESSAATETYLAHQLPDRAGAIATPCGLLALLLAFDWRLGLLSLVPVVLAFAVLMRMTGARMQQKSAGLQRHIKSALERTEKKKAIMLDSIRQSDLAERDRVFGDLLTANLHLIGRGASSVMVQNYYEEGCPEVDIPLSTRLTPSQNAQSYYKKYRKAKVAEQYAREQLVTIERDLALLENALDDLDKCETTADLGEVRYVLSQAGFLRPEPSRERGGKPKKLPEGKPCRFTAPDGTVIEVGKNSLQNDRLTLHARGGETWLHAQGIPGSHVLIRTESDPSDETLLYAAKLAAYFSKGRNHPQLPVDYTRRKYVKKSANAPAGLVTYTNFKTLIIGLTPEDVARIIREGGGGK